MGLGQGQRVRDGQCAEGEEAVDQRASSRGALIDKFACVEGLRLWVHSRTIHRLGVKQASKKRSWELARWLSTPDAATSASTGGSSRR